MKIKIQSITDALLQIFYPHICAGCGSDALSKERQLCVKCLHDLPATGFEKHTYNPIEKILAGRVPFQKATAQFYFTKESLMQILLHQFKYRSNKNLGLQLGAVMGVQLQASNRFNELDVLLPLPLNESKERKRGYNQSRVLCQGIQQILPVDIVDDAVIRPIPTETQTRKNRIERWQNMEGKFKLVDNSKIAGRHVLLVDDVITTGATIEACAHTLYQGNATVSVATLCFASYI